MASLNRANATASRTAGAREHAAARKKAAEKAQAAELDSKVHGGLVADCAAAFDTILDLTLAEVPLLASVRQTPKLINASICYEPPAP